MKLKHSHLSDPLLEQLLVFLTQCKAAFGIFLMVKVLCNSERTVNPLCDVGYLSYLEYHFLETFFLSKSFYQCILSLLVWKPGGQSIA